MEYQKFLTVVKEEVEKRTGENYRVRVNDVMKNNGIILNGLTVMGENCNISPTIYLNPFYEAYENGVMTLGAVVDEVMETYERNRVSKSVDMNYFMDYQHIRRKITYKLIHAKKNQDLLEDVPYIKIQDLAIVFQCLVMEEEMGNATVLIHNAHMKLWRITEKQLYLDAIVNTPYLQPCEILPMQEVIRKMLDLDEELPIEEGRMPMYVLSNTLHVYGAACILYPNVLKNFANELETDLYILPSSVHEVILLPANEVEDDNELIEMVQDINETQLKPEEVLSNNVYYYSRDKDKFGIITETR